MAEVKAADRDRAGFIVYIDQLEVLETLPAEAFRRIVMAGARYAIYGEEPKLSEAEEVAFRFMRVSIDVNAKKYETRKQRNKEAVEKRWQAVREAEAKAYIAKKMEGDANDTNAYERIRTHTSDTNVYDRIQPHTNDTKHTDTGTYTDTGMDIETETATATATETATATDSATDTLINNNMSESITRARAEGKNVYGENVWLTKDERAKLDAKLGAKNAEKAIQILGAYKLQSSKVYPSDFGAINNWVIQRLEEDANRLTGQNNGSGGHVPKKVNAQMYEQREYTEEQLNSLFVNLLDPGLQEGKENAGGAAAPAANENGAP